MNKHSLYGRTNVPHHATNLPGFPLCVFAPFCLAILSENMVLFNLEGEPAESHEASVSSQLQTTVDAVPSSIHHGEANSTRHASSGFKKSLLCWRFNGCIRSATSLAYKALRTPVHVARDNLRSHCLTGNTSSRGLGLRALHYAIFGGDVCIHAGP